MLSLVCASACIASPRSLRADPVAESRPPVARAPAPATTPGATSGARAALATYHTEASADPAAPAVAPDLSGTEHVLAVAGALLSLLPGALGADLSVGEALGAPVRQGPRALVSWPVQIPLRFARPNVEDRASLRRTAVYSNHRIVLAPELAIGPQLGAPAPALPPALALSETAWVTFRARAHYRFVHHPRGGFFGWLASAGTTVEFWPVVRPSLGAELGLHLAACCTDATAVVQLVLRVDGFFAGDDPLRIGALLGWSFY